MQRRKISRSFDLGAVKLTRGRGLSGRTTSPHFTRSIVESEPPTIDASSPRFLRSLLGHRFHRGEV